MRSLRPDPSRGNALIMALLLMMLLMALVGAQSAVMNKNLQQARYFATLSQLQHYAESGVALAIHDFDNYITGDEGNIGTSKWGKQDDVGKDGIPKTLDEGEKDGFPTPGEPHLSPVPIGPSVLGARLLVSVYPTPYEGVFRILSTCFNDEASFTLEKVYINRLEKFAVAGAIFVTPDLRVSLKPSNATGNNQEIEINGYDHNWNGHARSGKAIYGLGTDGADSPGDNAFALAAQLPSSGAMVTGKGGAPSIGEIDDGKFKETFDTLRGIATYHLIPGTYDDLLVGAFLDVTEDNYADIRSTLQGRVIKSRRWLKASKWKDSDKAQKPKDLAVIYVDGDLRLKGKGGAGVLVVNGSLDLQGPFDFSGLIVVRGAVHMGGQSGGPVRILGGLMVDGASLDLEGKCQVLYSSEVIEKFKGEVRQYTPLYYQER